VSIDENLIRNLIAMQVPKWADLRLSSIPTSGTVNAIFRLGSEMYVRLPRAERFVASLDNELEWLPRLGPYLSLAVPKPVFRGESGAGYPFPWAIFRWRDGQTYAAEHVRRESNEAIALGDFIRELRAIDPTEAPRSHRDQPVIDDDFTKLSIEALPAGFDRSEVWSAWKTVLQADAWNRKNAVWIHGDLIPPNVLVHRGRISAVLDFGDVGVGDPAVDLIPAWSLFGSEGRAVFRAKLEADQDTWARARAFAFRQAVRIIPYYLKTHSNFVAMATTTIGRVLDDLAGAR
jgi:aminoglycoside phosphotransferase (APT) family kinase protein